MRITRRQLRQIIRESLPYRQGQPWTDPKAPVGDPVERAEDYLDRELTDDEIDAAMGWEPADPAGDEDFWTGYGDAIDGKGLPTGASPDYKAGWEDGKLDRVNEARQERRLRRLIRESLVSDQDIINALQDTWEQVRMDVGISNPTAEEKSDEALSMMQTYHPEAAAALHRKTNSEIDELVWAAFGK